MVKSKRKIMVVAVHPDDETLGAGGTLLRLKNEGAEIGWLIVTHMSTEYGWSVDRVAERDREIETIAGRYGFDYVANLGLQPAALEQYPTGQLVAKFKAALEAWKPDTVILPFWGDAHTDHQVAFQAFKSCLKRFRAPYISRVLSMEVVSETNFAFPETFHPNCYVDIASTLEQKLDLMQVYASEIQQHPFPRSSESLRALAVLRGAEAGYLYAESFQLISEFDSF